jgi:uncharacterized protein YgiM (DUF1202 family)
MKLRFLLTKLGLVAILVATALMLARPAVAATANAQAGSPAVVNTGALNVRAGAGPEFASVAVVYQGELLTMLGRSATSPGWVYIRTGNAKEGWVNSTFLLYDTNLADLPVVGSSGVVPPTATPTGSTTPVPGLPIGATAVINTGALNVRSGPAPTFPIITTVYQGQTVALLARNADNTWVVIQTNTGVQGWVNAAYIIPSVAVSSLPLAGGQPAATATAVGAAPTATTPPVATAVPNTATVIAGTLNVRSGPGLSYARVTALNNGALVAMNGRNLDSSWVSINSASGQGWVNPKYLSTTTNVTTLPVTSQTGNGIVNTGSLNVRTNPGPNYPSLTTANYGANLTLLGRTADNTWLKVRAPNAVEGWANASLISTTTDFNQLPVLADAVPSQPIPQPPVNPSNTTSLRSCPSLSCGATGSVYSGLAVTATGRNADSSWIYLVTSNGQQGWIQSQYVQLGVPISTLPVING